MLLLVGIQLINPMTEHIQKVFTLAVVAYGERSIDKVLEVRDKGRVAVI